MHSSSVWMIYGVCPPTYQLVYVCEAHWDLLFAGPSISPFKSSPIPLYCYIAISTHLGELYKSNQCPWRRSIAVDYVVCTLCICQLNTHYYMQIPSLLSLLRLRLLQVSEIRFAAFNLSLWHCKITEDYFLKMSFRFENEVQISSPWLNLSMYDIDAPLSLNMLLFLWNSIPTCRALPTLLISLIISTIYEATSSHPEPFPLAQLWLDSLFPVGFVTVKGTMRVLWSRHATARGVCVSSTSPVYSSGSRAPTRAAVNFVNTSSSWRPSSSHCAR